MPPGLHRSTPEKSPPSPGPSAGAVHPFPIPSLSHLNMPTIVARRSRAFARIILQPVTNDSHGRIVMVASDLCQMLLARIAGLADVLCCRHSGLSLSGSGFREGGLAGSRERNRLLLAPEQHEGQNTERNEDARADSDPPGRSYQVLTLARGGGGNGNGRLNFEWNVRTLDLIAAIGVEPNGFFDDFLNNVELLLRARDVFVLFVFPVHHNGDGDLLNRSEE